MFKLECLAVEFINYLLNRGGFQFKFSIYRERIWCVLDAILSSTSAGGLQIGNCVSLNLSLNRKRTWCTKKKMHVWKTIHASKSRWKCDMWHKKTFRRECYMLLKPDYMYCKAIFHTLFSLLTWYTRFRNVNAILFSKKKKCPHQQISFWH